MLRQLVLAHVHNSKIIAQPYFKHGIRIGQLDDVPFDLLKDVQVNNLGKY
ncbi:hypothetical protein [Paenibacillus caui]|nr:hypothetical protein [Paenibacillus caui]